MSTKRRRDERDDRRNDEDHRHSKRRKRSGSRSSKSRKHKDDASDCSDEMVSVESKFIDHPKWKYKRISKHDYYLYFHEFGDWALSKKGKYLDEMSTAKAQKLFKKFVRKWNEGKLVEKYYNGSMGTLSVDNRQRTRYQWGFEKKMDQKEKMEHQLIIDTIDTETNQPDELIINRFTKKFQQRREREQKNRKWQDRNGRDNDVDFENDTDGVDADTKLRQQREREDQKSKDRRKRIKDIRKQHRDMERQKANSQMMQSFQSFVSDKAKRTKRK